jgi:hypothetical protein
MMSKPPRPRPAEKVTDYDDRDPYSCVAAGAQEERLQRDLQARVEQCFGRPGQPLQFLLLLDQASVRTALYDIWDREREAGKNRALADWAAQQMAAIGRALPDMPTNWPTSVCVPEWRTSSHALRSPPSAR